mmetsp:Transcript_8005/g.14195  ORF Transcript_8005/g.14195 Transcript_8005/m.14195 type:complete len:255 (-) Transcript_8005:733-1497(-)
MSGDAPDGLELSSVRSSAISLESAVACSRTAGSPAEIAFAMCRTSSKTNLGSTAALPNTVLRYTSEVGQCWTTLRLSRTVSSPARSQLLSSSIAKVSSSEPVSAARKVFDADRNSLAKRCRHCTSLNAQLKVTGTWLPSSAVSSASAVKRRLRQSQRGAQSSRSSSRAAVIAVGRMLVSSKGLLMSRETAFETIRHFGAEGAEGVGEAISLGAFSGAADAENIKPSNRIACEMAVGGSEDAGLCASTDRQRFSA